MQFKCVRLTGGDELSLSCCHFYNFVTSQHGRRLSAGLHLCGMKPSRMSGDP